MGTVLIHAGMGKAGSSTIQGWLAPNAAELRERDIDVVVARLRREESRAVGIDVTDYRSGQVQSNDVIIAYWNQGVDKRAVFGRLFEGLDEAATRHRVVVLTGEALQRVFWRPDEEFLRALEALAGRHEVRVAYYVRPQHGALEAAWRQWGFRTGHRPSHDLATRSKALHYFDTYASTRRLAPSVSFEPRPFRPDLLHLGEPVADFVHHFLGLAGPSTEDGSTRVNRGLPLEVVNALRHAPPGLFWSSTFDNRRLGLIKKVVGDLDAPETEETKRSRLILQAHCHDTFEEGNSRLIDALGWNTDAYVPAVEIDRHDRERGLQPLDELWEPRASPAELTFLYTALDRLVAASAQPDGHLARRRMWRRFKARRN
ncbi:MAG: hypothetical protein H0U12_05235 [Thermoleophilaceae bacterium]|nr:hypothetical protein [Thermoleophilaceae bacterium]